jgi:hypothetical protein
LHEPFHSDKKFILDTNYNRAVLYRNRNSLELGTTQLDGQVLTALHVYIKVISVHVSTTPLIINDIKDNPGK